MLLFHLGLEFSLRELLAGGTSLLTIGGIYLLLNLGGGLAFGFALGWGWREALVIAGAIGISSSAIVTKLLTELHRLANPESRLILGIIVVEDVFLALYLALLAPVLGEADNAAEAIRQFGAALAFLLVMTAIARFGAGLVGRLISTSDDELLTVCFVGLAVLGAGVAEELGVSDAIGAFMVGLVLAESPVADRIARLVLPLRDAFAAVFFFTFGLTIDPGDAGDVIVPVLIAVVLSVFLNVVAGLIAARLQRLQPRCGGQHRPDHPRPRRVLADPRNARGRGRPRRAHRAVRRLLRLDPGDRRARARQPFRHTQPPPARTVVRATNRVRMTHGHRRGTAFREREQPRDPLDAPS